MNSHTMKNEESANGENSYRRARCRLSMRWAICASRMKRAHSFSSAVSAARMTLITRTVSRKRWCAL